MDSLDIALALISSFLHPEQVTNNPLDLLQAAFNAFGRRSLAARQSTDSTSLNVEFSLTFEVFSALFLMGAGFYERLSSLEALAVKAGNLLSSIVVSHPLKSQLKAIGSDKCVLPQNHSFTLDSFYFHHIHSNPSIISFQLCPFYGVTHSFRGVYLAAPAAQP